MHCNELKKKKKKLRMGLTSSSRFTVGGCGALEFEPAEEHGNLVQSWGSRFGGKDSSSLHAG